MLRSVDILKLTVGEISNHKGEIKSEVILKQKKTGVGHEVIIADETKQYLKDLISLENKYDDDFLFSGGRGVTQPLTTRRYRDLVKLWVSLLGLDPSLYSTHSLRRTRASLIYNKTNNIEAVRILLGQKSVTSTSSYLGLEKKKAIEISKEFII
jgi:integrase